MDYSSVLSGVIQAVTRAGELLVAEWQRPEGPRGAGDKADVDVEIEVLLRPCLLDLLDGDFWGEETGHSLTGAPFCWVVDPNDGTADFLKGFKGSALEIPNADAEALLRFLQKVNAQEQCPSDPWEASRLESALEELVEALEADLR